ncbi:hypothetical protein [Halosimplex sp. J119]
MAVGTQSHAEQESGRGADDRPEIAVRESSPERYVFVESGNTEGWIATDATREVPR